MYNTEAEIQRQVELTKLENHRVITLTNQWTVSAVFVSILIFICVMYGKCWNASH